MQIAGLSQGVNYRGTLQVAGPLETVGWLLGDAATVDISGGIAFTDSGHPEMDLRCQALGVRQIGQFRLGFALHLTTKFLEEEDILDASFRLVTTLNVTLKGSTAALTVVGEFRRHPGILVFQASIASGIATSLSDLATLANGADLTSALPDGFDAGGAISLSGLRFVVDTNATRTGLDRAWTGLPEIVEDHRPGCDRRHFPGSGGDEPHRLGGAADQLPCGRHDPLGVAGRDRCRGTIPGFRCVRFAGERSGQPDVRGRRNSAGQLHAACWGAGFPAGGTQHGGAAAGTNARVSRGDGRHVPLDDRPRHDCGKGNRSGLRGGSHRLDDDFRRQRGRRHHAGRSGARQGTGSAGVGGRSKTPS